LLHVQTKELEIQCCAYQRNPHSIEPLIQLKHQPRSEWRFLW